MSPGQMGTESNEHWAKWVPRQMGMGQMRSDNGGSRQFVMGAVDN